MDTLVLTYVLIEICTSRSTINFTTNKDKAPGSTLPKWFIMRGISSIISQLVSGGDWDDRQSLYFVGNKDLRLYVYLNPIYKSLIGKFRSNDCSVHPISNIRLQTSSLHKYKAHRVWIGLSLLCFKETFKSKIIFFESFSVILAA